MKRMAKERRGHLSPRRTRGQDIYHFHFLIPRLQHSQLHKSKRWLVCYVPVLGTVTAVVGAKMTLFHDLSIYNKLKVGRNEMLL